MFHKKISEDVLDRPDQLLDLLPIAVYVCDWNGVVVRYNRGAAALWGRSPEPGDVRERFCGSFRLHRADGSPLARTDHPMAGLLRTGVPVRGEDIVIERPDGSRIAVTVDMEPLRDAAGTVVGAVGCLHDMTAPRHLQAVPHVGQPRSREILEALPVAVYTTDAHGRITSYNKTAADLWGRHPELGSSAWCGSWRLYWPDGRPMAHDECPMAVAIKQGQPGREEEAIAERPDGTRVPFLAYPTPLWDEDGALIGAVNTLVDITERKRGEEYSQRLASIVEFSGDAVLSKDLDGIITSWNRGAQRLFGYRADEVIGKPVTILIPANLQNEEPAILERIRRGEYIDHYETIRRRKDGSLVEISLTVSPVRNADGRITGASKIARDITDRKRAQERQTLLLREMNHRVKNLFALAGSLVTLSRRSAKTPEDMAAAVHARLGALARAHSLTLPDFAEGEGRIDKATTLHALIRTIVSPFEDAEPAGRARVLLDGPDVEITSEAATGFALLMHELATNAAKYGALSSPAGRVSVAWSADRDRLLFTWRERGGPRLEGEGGGEGFGSLLARATVQGNFGGEIERDWTPEGLTVRFSVLLDRLTP